MEERMNIVDSLDLEKAILEREKYLKTGYNVIHLQYVEGVLSDDFIENFEHNLQCIGFELSRYCKCNSMHENPDELILTTYFLINPNLVKELLKGKESGEVWVMIKYLLITTWNNMRKLSNCLNTSEATINKELMVGLKMNIDINTTYDFILRKDLDEISTKRSLDKIAVFLREHESNKNYRIADHVIFDMNKDKWIILMHNYNL